MGGVSEGRGGQWTHSAAVRCACATATVPRAHAGAGNLNRHWAVAHMGRERKAHQSSRNSHRVQPRAVRRGCWATCQTRHGGLSLRPTCFAGPFSSCTCVLKPCAHARSTFLRVPFAAAVLHYPHVGALRHARAKVSASGHLGIGRTRTRAANQYGMLRCAPNAFALLWPPLNRKRRIWREKTGSWR